MANKDWKLERKGGNFTTYQNRKNRHLRTHLRYNPVTGNWTSYVTDGTVEISSMDSNEKKDAITDLKLKMIYYSDGEVD